MRIPVRRGLDISVAGVPRQTVCRGAEIGSVALLGRDIPDIRPAFAVEVGARVLAGDTLFVDRRRPDIAFVAPAAGTVTAIHRGYRRALDALVIAVEGDGTRSYGPTDSTRRGARDLLLRSGLWAGLRARPFDRIPDPDSAPDAIFVTAMDTRPLAPDARVVLQSYMEPFRAGLELLATLTDATVFVCQDPGPALAGMPAERIRCVEFEGPHPAGLPGTHIHHLAPVDVGRVAWHAGYQDVVAMGVLVTTGRPWTERVVALAGPGVRDPRLIRTRLGANLDDLTGGEILAGTHRVLSGSVLGGREAGFLGRYHSQVSVVPAGRDCEPRPFLTRLVGRPDGAPVPMLPIGALERVMALDIPPVPLLRALAAGDVETAASLGCMQLAEEDMDLLSHVCTSKADYGALLRSVLDELEEQNDGCAQGT